MPNTVENSTVDNAMLKNLIEVFQTGGADQSLLLNILGLFRSAMLYVPTNVTVSQADAERFAKAQKGDTVSNSEAISMRPDLLKTPDGKLFFPAFTSKEETPDEYRDCMSWLQLEGLEIAKMARAKQDITGVVINGFSRPMVLPGQLLDYLIAEGEAQRKIEKGSVVELRPTGSDAEAIKKAAKEFFICKGREVNFAFLVELRQSHETSYLFVLEAETEAPQTLFAALNAAVQPAKPRYPVDYIRYPQFREQLEAISFPVFYRKDGFCPNRDTRSMEPDRLFFISRFMDEEGHVLEYSFDFEKAADSHYCIVAEEAMRLLMRMGAELEADFAETVAKAIGAGSIPSGYLEDSLRELLEKCSIAYSQFHFD